MYSAILIVGLAACSLFVAVHSAYFLLVLRTKAEKEYFDMLGRALSEALPAQELPTVSVVIPVHNEEQVIQRKMSEIAELDYPAEKIEVLLVDDCSADRTVEISRKAMASAGLNLRILANTERMGTNACYNTGIGRSTGSLVLTTDADVTLSKDALMSAAKILVRLRDVGGITARTVTISGEESSATVMERSYRATFDKMSTAESAIHSTFPGYTACMILRRSAFSPMSADYGSSDGNISLGIIRRGLRFIYVPHIFFYEHISGKLDEQKAQKIRRAARLIQSTLRNRDMLFKSQHRAFGSLVFPLRFSMMIICPPLLLVGGLLLVVWAAITFLPFALVAVLLLSSLVYVGTKVRLAEMNFFSSVLAHEFYLLCGLFESRKSFATWSRDGRGK